MSYLAQKGIVQDLRLSIVQGHLHFYPVDQMQNMLGASLREICKDYII